MLASTHFHCPEDCFLAKAPASRLWMDIAWDSTQGTPPLLPCVYLLSVRFTNLPLHIYTVKTTKDWSSGNEARLYPPHPLQWNHSKREKRWTRVKANRGFLVACTSHKPQCTACTQTQIHTQFNTSAGRLLYVCTKQTARLHTHFSSAYSYHKI